MRSPESASNLLGSVLRDDWGLNHLLQAIALGDGFNFHLLTSDTPRVAQAAFQLIQESQAEALLMLEPEHKKGDASKPLQFDDLVPLLRQLMGLLQEYQGLSRVLLVNASTATPKDERAWREFFRRLNERRNILTLEWRGPFILCVPAFLEIAFAHEAPDFWSIRSTSVVLAYQTTINQAISPPSRGEDGARIFPVDPVGPPLSRIEDAPDNLAALTSRAIRLGRLGSSHEEQRNWSLASRAYGEAVEAWRRVLTKNPKSLDGWANLAGTLLDLGDVRLAAGDLKGARSSYEAAVDVLGRLGEGNGNEGFSLALARALVRLGDLQKRQRGDSGAQVLYQRALESMYRSPEPDRSEWLRILSTVLERIGDTQSALGESVSAGASYQESLTIMRRLLEVGPGRAQWFQDLAVVLTKVGDAQSALGDVEEAGHAYEEALSLMREIIGLGSGPKSMHNFAVLLDRIGNVEQARGDFSRAMARYEEAIESFKTLLRPEPDSPEWIRDFVAILIHKGDLQKELGDLSGAQASYEDSLAMVRNGLEREPDNPDWPYSQALGMMKFGEVRKERSDLAGARLSYEDALKVIQDMKVRFPEYHSAQALSVALANAIDGIKEAQSGTG